jgi:hypothetical protein
MGQEGKGFREPDDTLAVYRPCGDTGWPPDIHHYLRPGNGGMLMYVKYRMERQPDENILLKTFSHA